MFLCDPNLFNLESISVFLSSGGLDEERTGAKNGQKV